MSVLNVWVSIPGLQLVEKELNSPDFVHAWIDKDGFILCELNAGPVPDPFPIGHGWSRIGDTCVIRTQ